MSTPESNAAEQEFQEFKWDDSAEWKKFLENVYPEATEENMARFKRRFFRSHVNHDLPTQDPRNATPAAATPPTATPTPAAARNAPAASASVGPRASATQPVPVFERVWAPIAQCMSCAALLATALYILPTPYQNKLFLLAVLMYAGGFLAAAVSQIGLPRLDIQYWHFAIYNAYIQAMIILLPSISFYSFLGLVSAMVSAVSYVCQRQGITHPILTRFQLNQPYVEIFFACHISVMCLMGQTRLINVMMYWNSLRVLYGVKPSTKKAFANMNTSIISVMPTTVLPYYLRFSDLLWRYSEPTATR